jgi:hypothetical protein
MTPKVTPIKKCANCAVYLNKTRGKRKIITAEDLNFFSKFLSPTQMFCIDDVICSGCPTKAYRARSNLLDTSVLPGPSTSASTSVDHNDHISSSSSSSEDDNTFVPTHSKSANIHEDYVELPIQRTVSTHGYCFVCGNKSNLKVIPKKA